MTPTAAEVDRMMEDAVTLVNNNALVEDLRSALSSGERAHALVPDLLGEVMEVKAWLNRQDQNGNLYPFNPNEFKAFIEGPAPRGLATQAQAFEKYIGDNRVLRAAFDAALEFEGPGNPLGSPDTPRDTTGRFTGTFNIVKNTGDQSDHAANLDLIDAAIEATASPQQQATQEPVESWADQVERRRDSAEPAADHLATESSPKRRETFQGNSAGYAARRLSQQRPDIFARVLAGELTCHAGMVEAGFRTRTITLPVDPEQAARVLRRHFTADQLETILSLALEGEVAYARPTLDTWFAGQGQWVGALSHPHQRF